MYFLWEIPQLKMAGPILDIRGIGAFFGAKIFIKQAFCLLAIPNQMSFLTISNEYFISKIKATV